jgi:uncharacterized protein
MRSDAMRTQLFGSLLASLTLIGAALLWHSDASAGGLKSDSKVKATATATKPVADGKQTVTITLEIEKGWHIYANPVGDEDFEGNKTRVNIKAKDKVQFQVAYPAGKVKTEGKLKFNVYEDKVTIKATVLRTAGDASPLQVSIDVNSCNKGTCLLPGTVKLTVP